MLCNHFFENMTRLRHDIRLKVILKWNPGPEYDLLRLKSVYKIYAYFEKMWIKFENPDKHGVLPTKTVDNHVENVDFPVDRVCVYTFFCHKNRAWNFVETEIFRKCVSKGAAGLQEGEREHASMVYFRKYFRKACRF